MRFVNDGPMPGGARRPVRAPGERGIYDQTFQHAGGAVATVVRQVFVFVADLVAEKRIVPLQSVANLFSIWIEQQLVMIKSQSLRRLIRTAHPIAVKQPGSRLRQITVPYLISLLTDWNVMNFAAA